MDTFVVPWRYIPTRSGAVAQGGYGPRWKTLPQGQRRYGKLVIDIDAWRMNSHLSLRKSQKSGIAPPSYVSKLLESLPHPHRTSDEDDIMFSALSLYTGGADTVRKNPLMFLKCPLTIPIHSKPRPSHLFTPSFLPWFSTLPSKRKRKLNSMPWLATTDYLRLRIGNSYRMLMRVWRRYLGGIQRCLLVSGI